MGAGRVQVVQERVVLDAEALVQLRERLSSTRLAPAVGTGWERGAPREWLAELLEDWRALDTDALQERLDALVHLSAEVDGHRLHVVHAAGRGPDPVPLVLTHGWPGSFLGHLLVLPLLTDPGAHGADPGQALTVVAPSLPGFGWRPPRS